MRALQRDIEHDSRSTPRLRDNRKFCVKFPGTSIHIVEPMTTLLERVGVEADAVIPYLKPHTSLAFLERDHARFSTGMAQTVTHGLLGDVDDLRRLFRRQVSGRRGIEL